MLLEMDNKGAVYLTNNWSVKKELHTPKQGKYFLEILKRRVFWKPGGGVVNLIPATCSQRIYQGLPSRIMLQHNVTINKDKTIDSDGTVQGHTYDSSPFNIIIDWSHKQLELFRLNWGHRWLK